MMSDPVIITEGLSKYYHENLAVDNVSLEIPKGSIFGIVGPDGAGKSSLIKILATIIKPSGGSAKILGSDLVEEKTSIRHNIGYMSEEFTLYQDLSVLENLVFFADVFGVSQRERDKKIKQLLSFSRLEPFINRRAQHLSGGMKQKLALACTLIHEPKVLFLDEPTRGVDPISRRDLWKILTEVNQRGVTVFLSTPYMDEAERCTHIGFLHKGRLLAFDTPQSVKKKLKGAIYKIRVADAQRIKNLISGLQYIEDVEIFGDFLKVVLKDKSMLDDLYNDLPKSSIKEITEEKLDLEMAFIFLMKQTENIKKT